MANPRPMSSNPASNVSRDSTSYRSHSLSHPTIDRDITTRRVTAEEIAYRNGYVQGREQERRIQQHQQYRMQYLYGHQGMVGGLLTGILLTLTVGFIATMLAVYSPQWEPLDPTQTAGEPLR